MREAPSNTKEHLPFPPSRAELLKALKDFRNLQPALVSRGYYFTGGELEQYLGNTWDYRKLPEFEGKSLLDLLKEKPSASVLDIGCGAGIFLIELKRLFPDIKVSGFDIFPHPGQERLEDIRWGDVLEITKVYHPTEKFDFVISSSVFHHLPDVFGALQAATSMLKEGGILLIGSIRRRYALEELDGVLKPRESRNLGGVDVVDVNNQFVPLPTIIERINYENPSFELFYSEIPELTPKFSRRAVSRGAQIAGRRFGGEAQLNLPFLFYRSIKYGTKPSLGYLYAPNENERSTLQKLGFIAVGKL